MEGVPYCNSSGCTLHDYPIGSPWCAYQYSLEMGSQNYRQPVDKQPSEQSIRNLIREEVAIAIEDLREEPVRRKPYTPRSESPQSNRGTFRGFKV